MSKQAPQKLTFENMLGMAWRNMDKKECDLLEGLAPFLESDTTIVHIGTDAQKAGTKGLCNYVVCVIVHDPFERGARVFYLKFRNIATHDLWQKLSNETLLSCTVASELTAQDETFRDRILVHVDANPDSRYASSDHVKSLAGMVMGYGFKHVLKPDSWASSHAADHIVKSKNTARRDHN